MTSRERRERAEALEREAEQTNDPDTWIVASDAWFEAGNPSHAWYARLRSREPYGSSMSRLIARARAEGIARAHENVSNDERGALELFLFMTRQPDRLFAYHDGIGGTHVGDGIRTFIGDYLGTVVHRGRVTRPFRNEARIQHVRVRAINGYNYYGTCALDRGNYCKLRRGGPWLR